MFYLVRIVRDASGKAVDLLYLEQNPASRRLTGHAAKGKRLSAINPGFDREWLDMVDGVSRSGAPLHVERRSEMTGGWHHHHLFPAPVGTDNVGVLTSDMTDRKTADAARRDSEQRQAFLLKLSDALRPLAAAAEIRAVACRLVAEAIGSDRVYYVDFGSESGFGLVADDYFTPGLPSLAGRYPVTSFSTSHQRHHSGPNWVVRDVFNSDDIADSEAKYYAEREVIAWVDIPLLKAGKLQAVLCVVQTRPRDWTDTEIGLIEDAADRLWAFIERARAEAALRESEERVRMALDAGRMGTWRFDLESGRQQWSEQQFRLFGLDANGPPPTREVFLSMVHPEDQGLIAFTPEDLLPGRGLLDAEFRIVRPDGETRWLVAHTVVRRDASGRAIEMVGLNWDITESRRAEEHQRLLTAELQHRVRNTLAVIRAIARRTAQSSDSVEALSMKLDGRLDAFARVQAAVTRDPVAGVGLATIIAEELRAAAAHEGETVSVDGPAVRLTAKAAETMALGLHELVTNAIKYGALTRAGGRIRVSWNIEDARESKRLVLIWKESGMTGMSPPTRAGLGTEVLTRTLPYELGAEARFTIEGDGLHYRLNAPDRILMRRT